MNVKLPYTLVYAFLESKKLYVSSQLFIYNLVLKIISGVLQKNDLVQ